MNCDEMRELMPELAAGHSAASSETDRHLQACPDCTSMLEEFRKTAALLDEWEAPAPSPYFDVRLKARLREENQKRTVNWLQWLRKPALVVSLMTLIVLGSTWYIGRPERAPAAAPGTAVGDLQALDKNQDLFADFDELDDLKVQQDVEAN